MCATIHTPPPQTQSLEAGPWRDFSGEAWRKRPDVRQFIQDNYQPYDGGPDFLACATPRTLALLRRVEELLRLEQEKGGVLDVDTERVAGINAYPPGYIDRDQEIVTGLQTDAPLKRPVNPYGGVRMARQACEAYGFRLDPAMEEIFTRYAPTHNDGVFRAYTATMRKARKSGVITGLPDAYGRGRIIGDYRRVALYGIDTLVAWKKQDQDALDGRHMDETNIRQAEELSYQIRALKETAAMADSYGHDIRRPAANGREAVQWTYFAYLAAVKEQNGAAMSLGRVSSFFDVYFARDFAEGTLDEDGAQEIIDDFVLKLRITRQLRTPEYNDLFAGDPTWVTECVGGMGLDGRTLVTKTAYRFINTLYTLKAAPEPNITVLWDDRLPEPFKEFCAQVSIDTDSIQYESDGLMRPLYGDDYGIACCVSAMTLGKQMQFFGARCNLPKILLMALNGGRDEITGEQIGPEMAPLPPGPLDYDTVRQRLEHYMSWLCGLYVSTMNVIHFMHDKYCYERIQMALHDTEVERLMAFGIAGLSVTTDSLSAIKHSTVTAHADDRGLLTDFTVEGDYPAFGNDNDRADGIAIELVERFHHHLTRYPAYRNALHTVSILTITSNVVYGKKTGATPDGRKQGEPFAPGANPMHKRDQCGGLASLNSVAKIPYTHCRDGISCTFSVTPHSLGGEKADQVHNLASVLDGYFAQGGFHINVNVLNRDQLIDAMNHPGKYPNLTIRVSGYAVNFNRLSREHQKEVIERTFHQSL